MIMMTDAQTDKNVVPMAVIGFVYVSAIEPIELRFYYISSNCNVSTISFRHKNNNNHNFLKLMDVVLKFFNL